MLTLHAYAKVNLTLEVLGRRDDGYHQVASVLQTIGLADALTLEEDASLVLACSVPKLAHEGNLVYRAARLLQSETGCRAGARMRLAKGIPVAAGLGGGSSDAAAALRGLDQLWGLGLEAPFLHQLAARLGADVPFFLHGGTALVEGFGQRVVPLPMPQGDWRVVLLHPPIGMADKTATLYRALPASAYTNGERTHALAGCLRRNEPLHPALLFNAFDSIACEVFPGLEECWRDFSQTGAGPIHVAGSGPTLFMLEPWDQAEQTYQRLRAHGHEAYLSRFIDPAGWRPV